MSLFRTLAKAIALLPLSGALSAAWADAPGPTPPPLPQYQAECAACHLAYPPGLLPAASWQRLMAGLGRHFGTDASLDASTTRAISAWLAQHAGTYKRVNEEPPQDRISRSSWFLRKHNAREVSPEVWKRAAVGSPANCTACHAQADKGNFNEHDVKIPK